jgi:hypothetical protein
MGKLSNLEFFRKRQRPEKFPTRDLAKSADIRTPKVAKA